MLLEGTCSKTREANTVGNAIATSKMNSIPKEEFQMSLVLIIILYF